MTASRRLHRPWLYPPLTPEAYRAYLARLDARKFGFLARRTEDGQIVGWLNVSEIVRGGFQNAFVGYGGIAGFSGQGYMTEALELVLGEAFGTPRAAPPRGQHPAGQRGVQSAGPACRIRVRGLLGALPESRRSLARS